MDTEPLIFDITTLQAFSQAATSTHEKASEKIAFKKKKTLFSPFMDFFWEKSIAGADQGMCI